MAGRDGRIGDLLHADSLDGTATDALLTESHAAGCRGKLVTSAAG